MEGDKRVNYFTWGERAHLEVDRSKMLGLMAGVGATRTHVYRHTHTHTESEMQHAVTLGLFLEPFFLVS